MQSAPRSGPGAVGARQESAFARMVAWGRAFGEGAGAALRKVATRRPLGAALWRLFLMHGWRRLAAGGGCEPTLWPRDGPAKKKGSAERRVESGFWKALSARGSIFEDAEKNEANCGFRIAEDGWAGMGVVGGDFWSEQSGPRAAAKAWTA